MFVMTSLFKKVYSRTDRGQTSKKSYCGACFSGSEGEVVPRSAFVDNSDVVSPAVTVVTEVSF